MTSDANIYQIQQQINHIIKQLRNQSLYQEKPSFNLNPVDWKVFLSSLPQLEEQKQRLIEAIDLEVY